MTVPVAVGETTDSMHFWCGMCPLRAFWSQTSVNYPHLYTSARRFGIPVNHERDNIRGGNVGNRALAWSQHRLGERLGLGPFQLHEVFTVESVTSVREC